MPRSNISQEFELETRDRYTKVETVVSISVDGKELPNMAVMGSALEEVIELIRNHVRDSYTKVPERTETPIATPVR